MLLDLRGDRISGYAVPGVVCAAAHRFRFRDSIFAASRARCRRTLAWLIFGQAGSRTSRPPAIRIGEPSFIPATAEDARPGRGPRAGMEIPGPRAPMGIGQRSAEGHAGSGREARKSEDAGTRSYEGQSSARRLRANRVYGLDGDEGDRAGSCPPAERF